MKQVDPNCSISSRRGWKFQETEKQRFGKSNGEVVRGLENGNGAKLTINGDDASLCDRRGRIHGKIYIAACVNRTGLPVILEPWIRSS